MTLPIPPSIYQAALVAGASPGPALDAVLAAITPLYAAHSMRTAGHMMTQPGRFRDTFYLALAQSGPCTMDEVMCIVSALFEHIADRIDPGGVHVCAHCAPMNDTEGNHATANGIPGS